MDQEEPKTDAPVKSARKRAPRKSTRSKTPAVAPEGDAGTPAASPAPEKVRKPRAPRRRKVDAPAAQPTVPAAEPVPAVQPAPVATEQPEARAEESSKKDIPAPAAAPMPQPEPAPRAEVRKAPAVRDEEDVPEPPAEFRKPDPVPGFAMPEVVGGNEGGGNNRRKRRRNRNRNREDNNRDQQQNTLPARVDPDELNRRAWKIFLGEVTEEGLALMDDRTAAEASRRAFKVAEIFLLEAARHRPAPTPVEMPAPDGADDASESE